MSWRPGWFVAIFVGKPDDVTHEVLATLREIDARIVRTADGVPIASMAPSAPSETQAIALTLSALLTDVGPEEQETP